MKSTVFMFLFGQKKRTLTTECSKGSLNNIVVMDGIEPPTQGFSVLCSTD